MTVVAVAVPLRDETQGLPALLRAMRAQTPGGWSELRIHLLFDGIDPSGLEAVREVADTAPASLRFASHVVERQAVPSAGRARRRAVARALSDRRRPPPDVLLTTDGDTVPAADWVARATSALAEVDVVAGHIARDDAVSLPSRDRLEAYLDALHGLRRRIDPIAYDPAPSHPWVGGANLGFRTAVYRALDGFRAVAAREDSAIVDAARHAGFRVRQARDVRVVTSSRLVGRIEGGLASAMTAMSRERDEPVMEHPADAARQYARHAWARRLRDAGATAADWDGLAAEVGCQGDALEALAAHVPNGEAFAMQAIPAAPTRRTLPLDEARAALDGFDPAAFRLG